MAIATWPVELNTPQPPGLLDEPQNDLVISRPDAGPAKVRRRFTAASRQIDIPIIFTTSQRTTFDTFWGTVWAQAGAEAGCFTWTDPHDDTSRTFRFLSRPRWRLALEADANADVRWEATLELEILP